MTASTNSFLTAVAGGTVGAGLTQAATFLRDWLNKRENGRFTALTLALQLDAFASDCTEPVFTLSNYAASNQQTSEPTGSLPSLEFSEKTDWRSLGTQHAEAVLGVSVKLSAARASVSGVWEHEGPTSAWGDASDAAIELGAAATQVARELRQKFRLTAKRGYDLEKFFADQLADLKERRAKFAQESQAFWADVDQPIVPGEPSVG